MQPILNLITERQATVAGTVATLRQQIGKLTDELRTAETELNDLATTHTTLTRLTSANTSATPSDPPSDNTVYQQIITAFTSSDTPTMRARDICHALGLGAEPKDTEGVRAKLKRLVKRGILTEPQPGQFTLTTPAEPAEPPTTSSPDPNPNTKPT